MLFKAIAFDTKRALDNPNAYRIIDIVIGDGCANLSDSFTLAVKHAQEACNAHEEIVCVDCKEILDFVRSVL